MLGLLVALLQQEHAGQTAGEAARLRHQVPRRPVRRLAGHAARRRRRAGGGGGGGVEDDGVVERNGAGVGWRGGRAGGWLSLLTCQSHRALHTHTVETRYGFT